MENSAHSFTEGAEYNPENETLREPIKFSPAEFYDHYLEVSLALSKLLELHQREKNGDETITMKEWNAAIAAAEKVFEKTR